MAKNTKGNRVLLRDLVAKLEASKLKAIVLSPIAPVCESSQWTDPMKVLHKAAGSVVPNAADTGKETERPYTTNAEAPRPNIPSPL